MSLCTRSIWLLGTLVLIWLMIMLGGATRLTHSGLSIVEWKPLTGIFPPFTHQVWLKEFELYKNFPEFQVLNSQMALNEFKFIYFMEYTHRLLARLIGVWFFVPLVYFWKSLKTHDKKDALLILLLGGSQGVIGWYMVKSGLVKDP
ncbi:MAG TPA: COX15/CtaA family protein, partial [Alphaproteobacteria bacterium]|nr:COX15/CtaA family protein [Alphaproteobacteria bacterium]